MKLPPPILEGTIPAFCGSTLIVPFGMNKSVSANQITGFSLRLKTVQSNVSALSTGSIDVYLNNNNTIWDRSNNTVKFTISDNLRIGQFYKVQMAYIGAEGIGYYSTVGIVKYTSEPILTIMIADDKEHCTGIYSQYNENNNTDYNEKVYSYCFTLKDSNNNIVETSGEILHNSLNDNILYESCDQYRIQTVLDRDKSYTLTYSIITVNGLKRSISTANIINTSSIAPRLNTKVQCTLDYENGCIVVKLVKPDGVEVEDPAVGHFYLLRSSDEDNFKTWREIFYFELQGEQPARHLWNDMTIKQGVKYKYAIQQFNNNGIYSNKIESNIVEADFEQAFLYDGER